MKTQLYLASGSPRRKELLTQIGVGFESFSVDLDETPAGGEDIAEYVLRMARSKAELGWQLASDKQGWPVLGADTAVCCDGEIFGKPKDRQEGCAMLLQLAGRVHQVYSAICLVDGERCVSRCVRTDVRMRSIAQAEAERYWLSGEPWDKAGGYAIQGFGGVFVAAIEGSYSAVVGLPLLETAELLSSFDIDLWQQE